MQLIVASDLINKVSFCAISQLNFRFCLKGNHLISKYLNNSVKTKKCRDIQNDILSSGKGEGSGAAHATEATMAATTVFLADS